MTLPTNSPHLVPVRLSMHAPRLGPSRVTGRAQVYVRAPEKVEASTKLGIKMSHITYLVHTDSTLPGLRADGVEVRRRFSEFDVSGG